MAKRRERHLYVALWFYIASDRDRGHPAHLQQPGRCPAGTLKSYSIYAGVQDAFMQWWYGHNAVAFFLTTPFLGLMYYFMPKAADRPVFSYRLSILHFWSLVFLYIWAGPHHLHYTALPEWASTLGMIFSVMLWMPIWGGMINGLLTLRGGVAEGRGRPDPEVLRGRHHRVRHVDLRGADALDQERQRAGALHRLDHRARPHRGPRLERLPDLRHDLLAARRGSSRPSSTAKKLAEVHFWIATFGIMLYVVAIYSAGVTQGLMWRAFDETGRLSIPTSSRRSSG